MTPEEINAATIDIEDNFPDLEFDTRQQFVDYVTARYEFPRVRTKQELIEELAGLEMDEVDEKVSVEEMREKNGTTVPNL